MMRVPRSRRSGAVVAAVILALAAGKIARAADRADSDVATTTPIRHVIIIIGENRSFDHLFATWRPPAGQTVANLLSKGIVADDGSPGANFAAGRQFRADPAGRYLLAPPERTPYRTLPPPTTGSAPPAPSDSDPPPFATLWAAQTVAGEDLPAREIALLTTGATGLPRGAVDTRIAGYDRLPNGPFPLTARRGRLGYDDYAASPVHRFYEMWQQEDCSAARASPDNPSGCRADLFPRAEAGSARPPHEGAIALGFYNAAEGDLSYFAALARAYTLADNYHQAAMGGTGPNHVMLGTGDMLYFTDGHGHPARPPDEQIEDPDPKPATEDGNPDGAYSACADRGQPGVAAILDYLQALPQPPRPNCAPDHFYLLEGRAPGYDGDGTLRAGRFVLPPSPVPSIADRLLGRNISWAWYGEGWTTFVANPAASRYCSICNPFLYETAVMRDGIWITHFKDTTDLAADIADDRLPAVSFVKPGNLLDGHPASSKVDLFEAFTRRIVEAVRAYPRLWAGTAIFITFDESGGYWDSGYIQPLDFFGDGPRVPLIVVSPFSRGGHVVHDYADHVSLLKFIERNWRLPPVSGRSRDNLPDPVTAPSNPYIPVNRPAIGDLFPMFRFPARPPGG